MFARMGVQDAWNLGFSGAGVTVAIVDNGVESTHPDLHENFVCIYIRVYIYILYAFTIGMNKGVKTFDMFLYLNLNKIV